MRYRVEPCRGRHLVLEEGDELEVVPDADAVLDVVYRRVHQRAFELAALRGWVRLHAAVVDGPAGRVLLVAPAGTAKTTLSCRLLLDGVAVAADESALTRAGVALPVARRFHLKSDAEVLVPDLGPLVDRLPASADGSVRALDPAEAGYRWSIEERPVDHLVVVSRADGPGTIAPMSAVEAMPSVVAETFRHSEPVGKMLGEIATLLRRARCWRLFTGPVAQAAMLIRSLPAPEREMVLE
jgi:hypothetical protein